MIEKRRLARIALSGDLLLGMLTLDSEAVRASTVEGIPDDAKALSLDYNTNDNTYSLLIESPELEEVAVGHLVPLIVPRYLVGPFLGGDSSEPE